MKQNQTHSGPPVFEHQLTRRTSLFFGFKEDHHHCGGKGVFSFWKSFGKGTCSDGASSWISYGSVQTPRHFNFQKFLERKLHLNLRRSFRNPQPTKLISHV